MIMTTSGSVMHNLLLVLLFRWMLHAMVLQAVNTQYTIIHTCIEATLLNYSFALQA